MKSFSISLWNIQGLNSSVFGVKSWNPAFIKEIRDIDILILRETRSKRDEVTGSPQDIRRSSSPPQN